MKKLFYVISLTALVLSFQLPKASIAQDKSELIRNSAQLNLHFLSEETDHDDAIQAVCAKNSDLAACRDYLQRLERQRLEGNISQADAEAKLNAIRNIRSGDATVVQNAYLSDEARADLLFGKLGHVNSGDTCAEECKDASGEDAAYCGLRCEDRQTTQRVMTTR